MIYFYFNEMRIYIPYSIASFALNETVAVDPHHSIEDYSR